MDQVAIPTNQIKINRDLRGRFEELLEPQPNGCILSRDATIEVKLIGSKERVGVSILRVAFMLGHAPTWANWREPWEHLTAHDYAVHICVRGKHWKRNEPVCVNWQHLRKGTRDDITVMQHARKHGLIMQEVSL